MRAAYCNANNVVLGRSLSGNSWFGRKSEVVPEYNEIVSVPKEGSEESSSDEENYEGNNVYTLQVIVVNGESHVTSSNIT